MGPIAKAVASSVRPGEETPAPAADGKTEAK
jgi:hypothetical protein